MLLCENYCSVVNEISIIQEMTETKMFNVYYLILKILTQV